MKNYDLENIKKVAEKSKKEAGLLFADLKVSLKSKVHCLMKNSVEYHQLGSKGHD